jgi:hypothetical protein
LQIFQIIVCLKIEQTIVYLSTPPLGADEVSGVYAAGILPAIVKFTELLLVLEARGVHQIYVFGTCWF